MAFTIANGIIRITADTRSAMTALSLLTSAGGAAGAALAAIPALGASAAGIGGVLAGSFAGVSDAIKGYQKDQDSATKSSTKSAAQEAANARQIRDAKQSIADAQANVARVTRESTDRINKAVEDQAETARRGADSIAAAQKSQADAAERGADAIKSSSARVSDALKAETRAQEDLSDARKDAAAQLDDLREKVDDYGLSQEGAAIRVAEAEDKLAKVNADAKSTTLDRRKAAYDLAEAQERVSDLTREQAQDTAKLTEAEAKGVDGSDAVVAAQQRLADAHDKTLDAQSNLAKVQKEAAEANVEAAKKVSDAQREAARANKEAAQNVASARRDAAEAEVDASRQVAAAIQNLNDVQAQQAEQMAQAATGASAYDEAMRKLLPSQQEFVRQLISMGPLVAGLQHAGADTFLPGLTSMLRDSEGLFPIFEGLLRRTGTIMGDTAREFGEMFKSDEFKANLEALYRSADPITKAIGSGFVKLSGKITEFGAKMAPAAAGFADFFDDIIDGFSGMLTNMEPYAGDFKKVWDGLGGIVKDILPPLGTFLGEAARILGPILEQLSGFLDNHKDDLQGIAQAPSALNDWPTFFAGIEGMWSDWLDTLAQEYHDGPTDEVVAWFSNLPDVVGGALSDAASRAGSYMSGLRDDIGAKANQAWTGVSTWFGRLGDDVGGWFSSAKNNASSWMQSTAADIGAKASQAWNNTSTWFSRLGGDVNNWFSAARTNAGNIMQTISTNVGAKASEAWRGFSDWFSRLGPDVAGWLGAARDKGIQALNALGQGFVNVKDLVAREWAKLQDAARTPVKWVVDVVYNNGIVPMWNGLQTVFGGGRLSPVNFAGGGVLPGYSPGRDTIPAMLSPGEGILTPEAVRMIGADNILSLNRRASGRRPGSASVGFAGGGIVGNIGDFFSNIAGGVAGWVGGLLPENAADRVRGLFAPIMGDASRTPGSGGLRDSLTKVPGLIIDSVISKAISKAKDLAAAALSAVTGGGGSGVQRWSGVVGTALGMVGQSQSLIPTVLRRMNQESGGNPTIVNKWDSNWLRGTPSVGLMQVIGPTYRANADSRRNVGPYSYGVSVDPLSNILASMHYAQGRYGSLAAAYNRPGGYDSGGWLPTGMSSTYNGTGRPEAVLTGPQWDMVSASVKNQTNNRGVTVENLIVQQVSGSPAETARFVSLALRGVG